MELMIPTGITDLGLRGLVTLGLLLIAFGKLIPRSVHADRVADKDAQIAEKNARISFLEAALEKRDAQLSEQINNNKIAVSALEAIRREAART